MKVGVTRVHRNQKGTLAETSLRVCAHTAPHKHTLRKKQRKHTPHRPLRGRPSYSGHCLFNKPESSWQVAPCAQPRSLCVLPTFHP